MEITRHIDTDKRIMYATVTGEITLDDVRADIERLVTQPVYPPGIPGLIDMRNATSQLRADEIQRLAYMVKSHGDVVGRTRRALLVSNDLLYGMYRMFAAYVADGPTEYRVFRDEDEARRWIEEASEPAEKQVHN
jgi:hypothetical protein